MTHILIDAEIVKAMGLSISLMGVMLSIIAVGISFLLYEISESKRKAFLWMACLISAWSVFIILDNFGSRMANGTYVPVFLQYPLMHLIAIAVGAIVFLTWLVTVPKFRDIFDKKLMIAAGIFAFLSVVQKFSFPYLINPYMGLLHKIMIILPPLIGLFMIIKAVIGGKVK